MSYQVRRTDPNLFCRAVLRSGVYGSRQEPRIVVTPNRLGGGKREQAAPPRVDTVKGQRNG
jgi:hypothetical protein